MLGELLQKILELCWEWGCLWALLLSGCLGKKQWESQSQTEGWTQHCSLSSTDVGKCGCPLLWPLTLWNDVRATARLSACGLLSSCTIHGCGSVKGLVGSSGKSSSPLFRVQERLRKLPSSTDGNILENSDGLSICWTVWNRELLKIHCKSGNRRIKRSASLSLHQKKKPVLRGVWPRLRLDLEAMARSLVDRSPTGPARDAESKQMGSKSSIIWGG
jgi:hypothetical protein